MSRQYLASCDGCGWASQRYVRLTHATRACNAHCCGVTRPSERPKPIPRQRTARAARPGVQRRTDEDQDLLTLATRIGWRCIRKYRINAEHYDDVMSDAMLGVAQASKSWRPGGNLTFGQWAFRRAHGAVLDGLRSRSVISRHDYAGGLRFHDLPPWEKTPLSYDVPLLSYSTGGGQALTLADLIGDSGGIEDTTTRLALQQALSGLNERERLVLLASEVEGYTLMQIAEALGVTESRVSQIRTGALRKARKAAA